MMEVGSLVKEHLFTNKKGEMIERYGVVIRDSKQFDGYVEVVWQPRPEHPVSAEAQINLALIEKLEVVVPATKGNATR